MSDDAIPRCVFLDHESCWLRPFGRLYSEGWGWWEDGPSQRDEIGIHRLFLPGWGYASGKVARGVDLCRPYDPN